MVEVEVVVNVAGLRIGQRVLLHNDDPMLRTSYVKPVLVPEVVDGKGKLESVRKSESGKK